MQRAEKHYFKCTNGVCSNNTTTEDSSLLFICCSLRTGYKIFLETNNYLVVFVVVLFIAYKRPPDLSGGFLF